MNKYNINRLITTAREKVNYTTIMWRNMKYFILLFAILKTMSFFLEPCKSILLVSVIPVLAKTALESGISIIKRRQANRKLRKLSTELRENGIPVSSLKLCKSEVGVLEPKELTTENGYVTENSSVAVFNDRLGRLRALKQVRYELSEHSDKSEYKNYTEIIKDSDEAKRLSLIMTRK